MSRRIVIASVVAGILAVGGATGGFAYVHNRAEARLDREARASADRFAAAWSHRNLKDMTYSGLSTDQVVASFKSTTAGLGTAPVKVTVTSLTRQGDKATGRLSVGWTVAEGATWAYTMPISLQRNDKATWGVVAKAGGSMWAPVSYTHLTLPTILRV